MDDNEARYLIDEYNTYISWRVGRGELRLVFWALYLAFLAVLTSVVTAAERYGWVTLPEYLPFGYLAIMFLVLYYIVRDDGRARQMYKDFETRLTDLEDYRRIHKLLPNKALPDEMTFRLLVETPDEAKALLEKSGPHHPV